MLNSRLLVAAVLCLPLFSGRGAEGPSVAEVRDALAKATEYLTSISTEGGYLWRYSADLKERRGEERATETQIWVQPPGTPAVGGAFLEAFRATGDERHFDAAKGAALALARGQLQSGGWDYLVEFDPDERQKWAYRLDARDNPEQAGSARNTTTFDDENTQSALRFLMAFLDASTNRPAAELNTIRNCLDYGLTMMIASQYPNGAWPQRWNGRPHDAAQHPVKRARIPSDWPRTWPRANYGAYYTLNDNAQLDCIQTMLEAARRPGEQRCLEAAKRGGDFLILAQLPEPQPGWAQQYNFNMEPAWARAFEPPAVCSSESASAMRMLVELYVVSGDQKYLDPIPPFLAWVERSKIGPERWARLYELGSNKPIYGDRDGIIHYTLAEISEERQSGYAWEGSFGVPDAVAVHERLRNLGREAYQEQTKESSRGFVPSASRVARILEQQDEQGRWLNGGWVDMRRFVINMRSLAAFLESELSAGNN